MGARFEIGDEHTLKKKKKLGDEKEGEKRDLKLATNTR